MIEKTIEELTEERTLLIDELLPKLEEVVVLRERIRKLTEIIPCQEYQ
jgi:hypothetical protein